jgi:hypothetical protein
LHPITTRLKFDSVESQGRYELRFIMQFAFEDIAFVQPEGVGAHLLASGLERIIYGIRRDGKLVQMEFNRTQGAILRDYTSNTKNERKKW